MKEQVFITEKSTNVATLSIYIIYSSLDLLKDFVLHLRC